MLGVLLILLPFVIGLLLYKFSVIGPYPLVLQLTFIAIGFLYWSILAPWYKFYAIKKIKNKKEYFLWKRLSVNLLLIWPDNFIGNKYELWNDKNLNLYNLKRKEIGLE